MVTWRESGNKRLDSESTLKIKQTGFAYLLDVGYKINGLN